MNEPIEFSIELDLESQRLLRRCFIGIAIMELSVLAIVLLKLLD